MPIDLSVLNPALPFLGGPHDQMLISFAGSVHVSMTVANLGAVLDALAESGAEVTGAQRRCAHEGHEWGPAALTVGALRVYLSTPHRQVDLVQALTETSARLAAGETLPEIAGRP
mgnify:FL=1